MQDENFDLNLVKVSRLIAACTLFETKDYEFYSYLKDNYEGFLHEIMEMGIESGEITKLLLPFKLNIQVVIFINLDGDIEICKFPELVDKYDFAIHIARIDGKYVILYYKQNLEFDGCNLEKGSFSFTEDMNFYKLAMQKI